jgi:hypothetical protein
MARNGATEPFWYRKVAAVARFRERGAGTPMCTIRLSHEEPLDVGYSEHVSRVADMLESAGVSDDMGEGSSITFHVTYRGEAR